MPEAYTTELAQLRDHVKPFPFAEVEAILARGIRPPGLRGLRLDRVRAAGLGVDLAGPPGDPPRRPDDRLKIRRPGIDKTVQADLDILKNLAQLAERRMPSLIPYGPVALARELERTLKRELDLSVERRTMERCRGQFAREPTAHIPEPSSATIRRRRSWRWS